MKSRCHFPCLVVAPLAMGFGCGGTTTVETTTSEAVALEAVPACVRSGLTLTSHDPPGPVEPHETARYDFDVTDNDVGACGDRLVLIPFDPPPAGISLFFDPPFDVLTAGQTAQFVVSVTADSNVVAGAYRIPVSFIDADSGQGPNASLDFVLDAPAGCLVRPDRELLIRDPSVVDDPRRTSWAGSPGDPRTGAWTFGRLIEALAPRPEDAPALVEHLFDHWRTDQVVNGFTVPARPAVKAIVLDPWPRRADGALDLTQAPMRLLAIVDRMDLRDRRRLPAGQARFVFGVLAEGTALPFTLILEYALPARCEEDVRDWARRWHALGQLPFPSEQYNAALQSLTDRFVSRGAAPDAPNGSALVTLRSNEIALELVWEMRQFELSKWSGFLEQAPVEGTPDLGFIQGSSVLADFINANEDAILRDRFEVPRRFEGQFFLGGSSFNEFTVWSAPGLRNPDARRHFALNACSGCHSSPETRTAFLHIAPREPGIASLLSPFLLGRVVPDPLDGSPHLFNELGRRKAELERTVCR